MGGKKAMKAAGKKNALAMKKKGVGIFAPKVLSPALATICGGKKMPRTEVTKKITAVKRAAGKKAMKAAGKKNALAMKKKGVGIFAPKVLSPALATICGGKKMARTEVTKKIWAYIKKNSLNQGRTIKPDSTL